MKRDHNHHYYCSGCKAVTATLHEIFPGNGRRGICIQYNIQVPLCQVCHDAAHGKYTPHGFSPLHRYRKTHKSRLLVLDQDAIQEHFCNDILEINYYLTKRAINSRFCRSYIEVEQEKCEKKLIAMRL